VKVLALRLESTSKATQESFGQIFKRCRPLGLLFLFRVLIIFPLINFVALRFGSTLFLYSTMQEFFPFKGSLENKMTQQAPIHELLFVSSMVCHMLSCLGYTA